jgi:hypothetical protein
VPDFDIMVLNDPLCEMNRVAIVPANKFFELDAVAVLASLHRRYFCTRAT